MRNVRKLISDRRNLFIAFALIFVAIEFGASSHPSTAMQARAESDKELAHILSVVQVKANPELTMEPTTGKGGLLSSPDRKYSGYVLCVPTPSKEDPDRCGHRVHFDDYTGARAAIFQISGEPELEEVTRTVDNLRWVNAFTLSYERWAGPHFGHRYLIDVRSKKQIAAYDLFG